MFKDNDNVIKRVNESSKLNWERNNWNILIKLGVSYFENLSGITHYYNEINWLSGTKVKLKIKEISAIKEWKHEIKFSPTSLY